MPARMVNMTVRISPGELRRVRQVAHGEGKSVSTLARERLVAEQPLDVSPLHALVRLVESRAAAGRLAPADAKALRAISAAIQETLQIIAAQEGAQP